jgi:hypothetical protein
MLNIDHVYLKNTTKSFSNADHKEERSKNEPYHFLLDKKNILSQFTLVYEGGKSDTCLPSGTNVS